jgi:hypothetical protein
MKQTRAVRQSRQLWMRSIVSLCLCLVTAVCVKAQSAPSSGSDESWTATRDTTVANNNPSRTTESHSKSGNRTVDKQTVEVLGTEGRYQPFSETEVETIQVDANTTRTVTRTYAWNGDGRRQLSRITEEDSRTSGSGDTHVTRNTSAADGNGRFQVVQRETADTRKISPNVEETKSTVFRPDNYGGFSQAEQNQELKTRTGNDTVTVKSTKMVPDGNGNWGVSQVNEKTIKDDGKERTVEERVSRPDIEGRLSENSRTVSKETQTPTGDKQKTVETYSDYVPGHRYDSPQVVQRVTIIQKKDSNGEIIEQQVEQPNGANPGDSPKVTEKTRYVVKYGYAGTQQTKTVQASDGNGNFYVVSSESQKSEGATPPPKPTPPPTSAEKPH